MHEKIAASYTEIPTALWEHGGKLELTAMDRALVQVLWSFKWYADSPIKPSMESLAERLGASTDTVGRLVKGLEERGLLIVHRVRPGKSAPVAEYDLMPLWERLADVVPDRGAHLQAVDSSAESGPQSADRVVRNLRTEVDEVEVDERSRPPVHTPAREGQGNGNGGSEGELIELLRRDVADPQTFPSTRLKALSRIDKLEGSARAPSFVRSPSALAGLDDGLES